MIDDDTTLKIIGFLITTLLSGMIGLLIYIWNQRKNMFDLELKRRDEFNSNIKEEIKELKSGIEKIDEQTDKLDILVRAVHETNRNLIGWMKQMQGQMYDISQEVKQTTIEVEKIKAANGKN